MFEKATLRLAGGRTLVISRKGEGIYVQKVALDDKPYTSTWLPIEKVHAGTTEIQFTNAGEPNKQYGSAPADRPPSFR